MYFALNLLYNYLVNSNGSVCTYGEVRLVGGDDKYAGRVEVCIENGWHSVCDNGWGAQEAVVVCGQLGYSYTGCKYMYYTYYIVKPKGYINHLFLYICVYAYVCYHSQLLYYYCYAYR